MISEFSCKKVYKNFMTNNIYLYIFTMKSNKDNLFCLNKIQTV